MHYDYISIFLEMNLNVHIFKYLKYKIVQITSINIIINKL